MNLVFSSFYLSAGDQLKKCCCYLRFLPFPLMTLIPFSLIRKRIIITVILTHFKATLHNFSTLNFWFRFVLMPHWHIFPCSIPGLRSNIAQQFFHLWASYRVLFYTVALCHAPATSYQYMADSAKEPVRTIWEEERKTKRMWWRKR